METPIKPGDQYIHEIVVPSSSILASDHDTMLGFVGAAAFAIVKLIWLL